MESSTWSCFQYRIGYGQLTAIPIPPTQPWQFRNLAALAFLRCYLVTWCALRFSGVLNQCLAGKTPYRYREAIA